MKPDTAIITPHEDCFYTPDWRFRIAGCLVDGVDHGHFHPESLKDVLVRTATRQLKARNNASGRTTESQASFSRVRRWHEEATHRNTGYMLEALLLTDAPMECIARDTGCDVTDVQLYERLCFNVRDETGALALAPAQRQYFATEGIYKPAGQRPEHLMWRRVAVTAGYRALLQVLELGNGSWNLAPQVDVVEVTMRMARGETLAKIASGGLNAGELARLEANRIKDRIARHMTGELKMKDEGMELAIQLLRLMAPTMVDHERIVAAQASAAAEQTLSAQEAIDQTAVEDAGPMSTNEVLDRELKKKAEVFRKMNDRQTAVLHTLVPAET